MKKEESHLRSILKGISWRIVATTDTVLIVLLITCLLGECSIGSALEIGAIEFVIKLAIYYIHERVWQKIVINKNVTKKTSFYKTVSWRIVATTTTLLISGAVLDNFEGAFYIAVLELITKFVLYYFHERLWIKITLRNISKMFFGKNK